MSRTTAFDELRAEVKKVGDVTASVKKVIADLVQRLNTALNGDTPEADIRQLRDDLEASAHDLSVAVALGTPVDPGPNGPDDSAPITEPDPAVPGEFDTPPVATDPAVADVSGQDAALADGADAGGPESGAAEETPAL